jgi:hypothetical protein
MPTIGVKNYKWANATQGIQGQLIKVTAAETADISTSIADTPFGPLSNAPKQGETAQPTDMILGSMVQVLADGTTDIAVGDYLKVNGSGRAVKATRSGTFVATATWIIGTAMEAFTTNGDGIITAKWLPQEGSWA